MSGDEENDAPNGTYISAAKYLISGDLKYLVFTALT